MFKGKWNPSGAALIAAALLASPGVGRCEESNAAASDAPVSESEQAPDDYAELDHPAHQYWTRALQDRFTQLKPALESGALALDRSSEKAFVTSLLDRLGVPATSQMLVFSTTSLQLRLISPRRPRAIYFNEDLYVGYVQRGSIEIVSLDPELGGIFYIFDIPRDDQESIAVDRADRCMNCHAAEQTNGVPGLVIKSVMPGPNGGSLDSYRRGVLGHSVPLEERFGGWHITGDPGLPKHWGNVIGRLFEGNISTTPVRAGEQSDLTLYPVATSDILPQLLHEHQAGFVNRTLEVTYRARAYSHESGGTLTTDQSRTLDEAIDRLVRYIFFADEAALPAGGLRTDPAYAADFAKNRRADSQGRALKDFDLTSRLFKFRCSYMIYSAVFQGMPDVAITRVRARMNAALAAEPIDPTFAYLPEDEKAALRAILSETVPALKL